MVKHIPQDDNNGGGNNYHRFVANPELAQFIWEKVENNPSLKWADYRNVNVMTLAIQAEMHGTATGIEKYYRRSDEHYTQESEWVTYFGIPGESPFGAESPQIDHHTSMISLSAYPYNDSGLMYTIEFTHGKMNEERSLFARVPIHDSRVQDVMDRLSSNTGKVGNMEFSHTAPMITTRFVGDRGNADVNLEEYSHVHIDARYIKDVGDAKDMVEVIFNMGEKWS